MGRIIFDRFWARIAHESENSIWKTESEGKLTDKQPAIYRPHR